MPITHLKVSPEPNPGDGRIGGEDWNEDHVGSPDWDYTATKGSDQSVTNSNVLVDETDLGVSVTAGDTWRFEWDIVYSSDGTGDYKWDLAVAAGTMFGFHRYIGTDTTANAILVSTGVRDGSVANTTDVAAGGGTTTVRRSMLIEAMFEFSNTTTITFRFAQNTTTSGQSAVTRAGSQVRARRLM